MKRSPVKTKRLIIRPLQKSDFKSWFQAFTKSLPKKSKYDRDPYTDNQCSRKQFQIRLDRYAKMANKDTTYVWGVFESKSKLLIGILDISIISRGLLQVANLGYRVFNNYWKLGFGKEFVNEGIKLGFKTL